jgi:hypothetical protein
VTTPAAAQAQASPQQPQQPQDDDGLIAVIVAALAAYVTAKALAGALRAPFKAAGISGTALSAAASLVASLPQEAMKGTGPAQRNATRTNLLRRASFFLNAARRTQAAIVAARSQNQPVIGAVRDALTAEKRYLAQHVDASATRVKAAAAVDKLAAVHGNLLGWQATKDPKCTPGCAFSSGKNFRADRPPIVEGHPAYPGSVHGSSCRCVPVAPFKGAPVLPSS